jgi:hypothetical protein
MALSLAVLHGYGRAKHGLLLQPARIDGHIYSQSPKIVDGKLGVLMGIEEALQRRFCPG